MIVSVVCYNHQFHSAPLAVGMLTNIQQRMLVQETFLQSICCHDSLDSTNNEAKRLIEAGGIQSPALIICRNQTLGRGRGRNKWVSGEGALTFTLVVSVNLLGLTLTEIPSLSLWTALGIREALSSICARAVPITVKWPNDVFCLEGKVAGILIESLRRNYDSLVVGVGINVNNRSVENRDKESPEANYSVTAASAISLAEATGTKLDAYEVLTRVLLELQQHWNQMRIPDASLPQLWGSHCRLTGKSVTLTAADTVTTGRCLGVDAMGALLIDDGGKTSAHVSGTVRTGL